MAEQDDASFWFEGERARMAASRPTRDLDLPSIGGPGVLSSLDGKQTRIQPAQEPQSVQQVVSAAAPGLLPFQPYLSRWMGEGSDPFAATRKMRFRIARGVLADRTPVNMWDEFVAYGDPADSGSSVRTIVYVTSPVAESALGSGIVTYERGTIHLAQGDDLVEAVGPRPVSGEDGALPAFVREQIFSVLYSGGSLTFERGVERYLDAVLVDKGSTVCDVTNRDIAILGL